MNRAMLVAAALVGLTLSAPTWAVDLVADGGDGAGFVAGAVDIAYSGADLFVTITSLDPWTLAETHVDVAYDAADVPQHNGNPAPGRFAYAEETPGTMHQYTIPCPYVEGRKVIIAVHAAIEWLEVVGVADDDPLRPLDDPADILHEESAWGDGTGFGGRNWGMYIEGVFQDGTLVLQ